MNRRLTLQPLISGGHIMHGGIEITKAAPLLVSSGLAVIKRFGSTAGELQYPFIEDEDVNQAKAVLRLNGFEVAE